MTTRCQEIEKKLPAVFGNYFKPRRKNPDFGFLPDPILPLSVKIGHLQKTFLSLKIRGFKSRAGYNGAFSIGSIIFIQNTAFFASVFTCLDC